MHSHKGPNLFVYVKYNARGIHFQNFGHKHRIDALALKRRLQGRQVPFQGPRVCVQVLVWGKLGRVDENRNHGSMRFFQALAHQMAVALVQGAHGWHETDRFLAQKTLVSPLADLLNSPENLDRRLCHMKMVEMKNREYEYE